jgi:hypothetical protein
MGYKKVAFEKTKGDKDQKKKGGKLEPQKKPKYKKQW